MLSSVLNSKRAISVNIGTMRTFVKLGQMLASNSQLSRRVDELEGKYDRQFKVVFDAIPTTDVAARFWAQAHWLSQSMIQAVHRGG